MSAESPATIDNFVVSGEHGETYKLLQRHVDNGVEHVLLSREDGAQITLPSSELSWIGSGRWLLTDSVRDARGLVIPVVEERLEVGRERVETGRVRIQKTVQTREETIDQPLRRERVRVEHIPINQVVSGPVPQVREEGDVTVIPILEERKIGRAHV